MAGLSKYKLRRAGERIAAALKNELRAQGHYDTGKLEASIRVKVTESGGDYTINVEALGYLTTLNKGQQASEIRRLNGAQLNKLAGWIQRKGGYFTYKQALSAAGALNAKWMKEGKPLDTAAEYSLTGETTGALDNAIRDTWREVKFIMDEEMVNELDIQFHKVKSGKV